MLDPLRAWLRRHPWWVDAMFLWCLFMTFVYSPFDYFVKLFFQDLDQAQEVWFGFMLRGVEAKLTEPLHWAIYGALAWGFWKERRWVWPAAALYVAQVAIAMLLWPITEGEGAGPLALGAIVGVLFSILSVALWRYRDRVASPAPSP